MCKRREQFNFRTSSLSDEAYKFIEYLSETRQLSRQIAVWAEQEIKQSKYTPQDKSSEILQELRTIKSMLQTKTIFIEDSHSNEQHPDEDKDVIQLVSSNVVNNVIEDEDEEYDY